MTLRSPTPQVVAVAAAAPVPTLPVPLLEQQGDEWCWAACLQMVLRYHQDLQTRQCQLADILFEENGCCNHPRLCDESCPVGDVAWLYDQKGLTAELRNPISTFAVIADEIVDRRPVQVFLDRGGRSGHVVIVTFARSDADGDWLWINDPLEDEPVSVEYDELLADGANRSWIGIEKG